MYLTSTSQKSPFNKRSFWKKVPLTKGPFDKRSFWLKVLLTKGLLEKRSFCPKVLWFRRSFVKGPLAQKSFCIKGPLKKVLWPKVLLTKVLWKRSSGPQSPLLGLGSSLTFKAPAFIWAWSIRASDGLSLRLGPGSARARHLEGLLELGFCRLDPSIGRGQASGSSLRPQARARLELGNWRLDPSLTNRFKIQAKDWMNISALI